MILLLQARWANASLEHTIRGATEPYVSIGSGRISIQGPDIRITSGAVIALAMTLNELCTNTTKFGALSVPAGRIEIVWKIDEEGQRLHLTWSEKNGPVVHAPSRQSFGTRLIGTLGQQLKGSVKLAYDATGFVYVLDVADGFAGRAGVTGSHRRGDWFCSKPVKPPCSLFSTFTPPPSSSITRLSSFTSA